MMILNKLKLVRNVTSTCNCKCRPRPWAAGPICNFASANCNYLAAMIMIDLCRRKTVTVALGDRRARRFTKAACSSSLQLLAKKRLVNALSARSHLLLVLDRYSNLERDVLTPFARLLPLGCLRVRLVQPVGAVEPVLHGNVQYRRLGRVRVPLGERILIQIQADQHLWSGTHTEGEAKTT